MIRSTERDKWWFFFSFFFLGGQFAVIYIHCHTWFYQNVSNNLTFIIVLFSIHRDKKQMCYFSHCNTCHFWWIILFNETENERCRYSYVHVLIVTLSHYIYAYIEFIHFRLNDRFYCSYVILLRMIIILRVYQLS